MKLWSLLFLGLMLGYALVIAASPSAPLLQDYPDWVYQGVLVAKVMRHPVPGYALQHYPVPNTLTSLAVGLLSALFGWKIAAKLWVMIVLGLLTAAGFSFRSRIATGDDAFLPILASTVLVGFHLWNGNVNFLVGIAFLLLLAAYLVGPAPSAPGVALLLVLIFFAHMLPCAAGMLLVVAFALQTRQLRLTLTCLPTLLLLFWYVLARDPPQETHSFLHVLPAVFAVCGVVFYLQLKADFSSKPFAALLLLNPHRLDFAGFFILSKLLEYVSCFGLINVLAVNNSSPHVLFSPFVFNSLIAGSSLSALLAAVVLFRSWLGWIRSSDLRRFLAVTVITLVVGYLTLPLDALGIDGIDGRFLHLALALGLGLLVTRSRKLVAGLALFSFLLGCVNLYQFAAVQFNAGTSSVASSVPLRPGANAVKPAMRQHYYQSLETGQLHEWIFPTAMLRQTKP